MHDAHEFLRNLALVLCVAAATSLLVRRLRLPVVFGYLIAGMLVGPHIPVPLVADVAMVRTLSELGVILLLFSLGLEFRLRKLVRVAPTAGLVACIESAGMVWLGFTAGRLFGWTTRESLFAGAIIAISSTTIIAKAFQELNITGRLAELVFGVLIVEDLFAVVMLAVLSTFAAGGEISAAGLGATVGRLAAFLAALIGFGLLVVPRLVRHVQRLERRELTLVVSIGICFGVSLLALQFGYSAALGAFLAGSLVAESGDGEQIAHVIEPVRDLFVAIFFVSVGMLIDPVLVAQHWVAVVVFSVLVLVGKSCGVTIGAFLAGFGTRTSVRAGLSMTQIGEFSFIIAGLGLASGATRDFFFPLAVAVSAITTLTTPWLIRSSGRAASLVDRTLPHAVQTFVSLYESWLERVRSARAEQGPRALVRRHLGVMLLDAILLAVLVIGVALNLESFTALAHRSLAPDDGWARTLVIGLTGLLAAPLAAGLVHNARSFGAVLADLAMPAATGTFDYAAAPRRMLVVTLQLGVLVLVGVPFLALIQPFMPILRSAMALGVILLIVGVIFWRRANDLYGHIRAGAEVMVMALAQHASPTGDEERHTAERMRVVLPGLGEPTPMRLDATSRAVGRTLASLQLRARTGATVLAIHREGGDALVPTGHETLRAGDILVLAGSGVATESARRKLGAHV